MPVARRTYFTAFTIPRLTPSSAPAVATNLYVGWCWLHSIKVAVPAGHNGLTGYAVQFNGIHIIPWPRWGIAGTTTTPYVIANNETNVYELETEVDTTLQVKGYNTDYYAHTIYLTLTYTPIALTSPATRTADIFAVA